MNGTSCTDLDAYGSTPGSLGTVSTTLAEGSLPGADPGYLCATPSTYITKSSSAGTGYVGPGQTITYTINVTNTTSTAWTGVAVHDPLPANTSFVTASTQVTKVTYPTGNYADSFANPKLHQQHRQPHLVPELDGAGRSGRPPGRQSPGGGGPLRGCGLQPSDEQLHHPLDLQGSGSFRLLQRRPQLQVRAGWR